MTQRPRFCCSSVAVRNMLPSPAAALAVATPLGLLCLLSAASSASAASKKSSTKNDFPIYPLPPYVRRACSRNDPKVTDCVMKIGTEAIKGVVKGDPKYRIPKLNPMTIDELRINQGTKQVGLSIICKKCLLYGLPDTKFVSAYNSWEKRECHWNFQLDKISVKGKYNVSGQVLLLPIFGNGDAEFDFYDLKFAYKYKWDYYKRANWTYVNITHSEFPLEIGNMTIKLENLFNGDNLLSSNMNRFINEHWVEILADIKPALSKSLADLTTQILGNMAKFVPFDIMFPEKYDPNED